MAQIKINSDKVFSACEKILEYMNKPQTSYRMVGQNETEAEDFITEDRIIAIKELAEYENCHYQQMWIDHQEFKLIKDYL